MSDKKTFVFDLDGTLCQEKPSDLSYDQYAYVKPYVNMVNYVNKLYDDGHYIIINTARHMKSTGGNVGLINQRVGKITLNWLVRNHVKYHELSFGKPYADYYVDDKAMDIGTFLEKMKGDYPE